MNTPKIDKGRPKFATLIRRLEIIYRPILVQAVKIEPQQLITHAVMQGYAAQIESVEGNRIWDKSPAIEVIVNQKHQKQLQDDAMHNDLRILVVEGFQTILIR